MLNELQNPKHFLLTYHKVRRNNRITERYYYTGDIDSPIGTEPMLFDYITWQQAEAVKKEIETKTGMEFKIYLLTK